jgi:hypothetical protein
MGDAIVVIAGAATIETGVLDDFIMPAIVTADSVTASAKSGKSEGDNVASCAVTGLVA